MQGAESEHHLNPLRYRFFSTLLALVLAWMGPGAAHAQFKFDRANYTSLADASSGATIPAGTRITLRNWQQYRTFMPMGFVAAYSQRYGFKIGDDPKYTINVGPTVSVPMFKQLQENTEQVMPVRPGSSRLPPVAIRWRDMWPGSRFPKPSGPLMAYQLLYNVWSNYFP